MDNDDALIGSIWTRRQMKMGLGALIGGGMAATFIGCEPYSDRGQRNMLNTDDGIFSERLKDGSLAGSHQLLPVTPAIGNSFRTQFAIVLSDATLHDPDSRNHGGPGGPGGPPPGGPGGGPPDDGFGPPNW
jgi:hypothetical protein